ncbi:MAG: OadG family protein [Clostridia bacterium]|nr:OadG family protein [Clostridia bacterium]
MMNSNLFVALTANGRSLAENAKEAGTVTLLGMVAIFAVLSLLWLVIEVLHRVLSEKKDAPVQKKEPAPIPEKKIDTPAPAAPVETATAPENDGALIAAITAAISAAMADEGYTGGFRVVSFKRASVRRNGRV